MFFPLCEKQSITPDKTTGKIIVLSTCSMFENKVIRKEFTPKRIRNTRIEKVNNKELHNL